MEHDGLIRKISGEFYRGTKSRVNETRLTYHSWTPSIDVASVYSSTITGNGYINNLKFGPSATVHAAHISAKKALDYISYGHQTDFPSLISAIHYGKVGGMTELEARQVLRFLHKRMMGQLPNYLEFAAEAWRSSDSRDDESPLNVPLTMNMKTQPTCVSQYDRIWSGERQYSGGPILVLDTFAFVDCPVVLKVCERLGIDAILYADAFDIGSSAAKQLFGLSGDDPEELLGVEEEDDDIDSSNSTWVHETIRPMRGAIVRELWSRPTSEIEHAGKRERSNPRRRRR